MSSSSSSPYPSSKTRTAIEAYPPHLLLPVLLLLLLLRVLFPTPVGHSAGEERAIAFYPRFVTCCHSLKLLGTLPKLSGPTAPFNVAGSCDVVRFWGGGTGFLLLLISVLWRHRTSSGVDCLPLLSRCFVLGTLKCPCMLASYEGRLFQWLYPPHRLVRTGQRMSLSYIHILRLFSASSITSLLTSAILLVFISVVSRKNVLMTLPQR